ncbi:MAG: hypothetical protein HZA78_05580 [Candidatus Schekmanbacteria bacterium]|nr:hypothetical protein [Candidatus Schekmanbacteria bacterium]
MKKPVIHLWEYLQYGEKCNQRLLTCFSNVDVASLAENEMDKLNQPVITEKGKKIAAPDLRKKRQIALFSELLKVKYSVHGFKTSDLLENLPEFFTNLAQRKLRNGQIKRARID